MAIRRGGHNVKVSVAARSSCSAAGDARPARVCATVRNTAGVARWSDVDRMQSRVKPSLEDMSSGFKFYNAHEQTGSEKLSWPRHRLYDYL